MALSSKHQIQNLANSNIIFGPFRIIWQICAHLGTLFVHVHAALISRTLGSNKSILFAHILDPY